MKARIAKLHHRQLLRHGRKLRWGNHYFLRRYFRPRRPATVAGLNPLVSWFYVWLLAILTFLIPFLVGIMALLMR
jgi:hypothetical protein